jgi:hypothetical protein
VGAVSGVTAGGRATFDAVYDKEMVQPLDSVQVELCEDACCAESYLLDEFDKRVYAEGEEGGETGNGGCVGCACAAHDYG